MASGGNHPPRNPAPVSGPGALSRRTDGQPIKALPNAGYGENKDFTQIQAGAPMATSAPQGPAPSGGQPPPNTAPLIPMGAPTQYPNEPVTAGANAGPGPDQASLGLGQPVQANWQNARDVVNAIASKQGSSPAMQMLASRLKGAY